MDHTAQAYRDLVDARIHELLTIRRWYRENRWANWTDLRAENEMELRALVRLARVARALGATAVDYPPTAEYATYWS